MQINAEPYTGWGRTLSAEGGRARPEKARGVAEFVAQAPGPALGNARSYGDAPLCSDRVAIDMTRLDRLISFDADTGVLEAEAGVPLRTLLDLFVPRGWMPPVIPGTGFATLGGAIAADVHGKNHHVAGSFGAHVLGVELIGADGQARWITPQDPLFAVTLGGMGLTGIITRAQVQMARCGSAYVDLKERRMPDLATYLAAFEASEAPYSVGWIDATAKGARLGRGIFEEAHPTTRQMPFVAGTTKQRTVPLTAPGFALASPIVRAFNTAYFRRVSPLGRDRTRPLGAFFFPLDSLIGWNKLYGKRGFYQFQCVLPPDTAALTLEAMLRRIADAGLAAPLAVLKKLGGGPRARAGMMSFPMAGYTLAVDFPNRAGAVDLVTWLNDATVEAGGRVYLAKDALATPDQLARMYPDLPAFGEALRTADPDGVFETDLARRLNLRGAP